MIFPEAVKGLGPFLRLLLTTQFTSSPTLMRGNSSGTLMRLLYRSLNLKSDIVLLYHFGGLFTGIINPYLIRSFTSAAKLSGREFSMSVSLEKVNQPLFARKLVSTDAPDMPSGVTSVFVLISHREMDSLVGRLMQICDLTGDVEQRKALKDEIKHRCRDWLDDMYEQSGYDKWSGIKPGAKVIEDK